ncbi:MAG: maltokinase N-terminal cap-like domain-containing protein [Jatrophihabitans sp.]
MNFPADESHTSDLAAALIAWLPQQRWFAGKSRNIVEARPTLLAILPSEPAEVRLWLVAVHYRDGGTETYQLPLLQREQFDDSLGHAFVGVVDGRFCYDALWDKSATPAWLRGIAAETTAAPLQFHRNAKIDEIPVDAPSLVLSGEQSNTSAVFGDSAIMKVFRRIESGQNPDIEIHEALSNAGAHHIARLLGYLDAELPGGGRASLAMLQEFMTTATDGWELAKISVRDLMAEADLHAEEAGGDFAGEAYRLGQTTAAVHTELAAAFGTSTLGTAELAERAAAMSVRLDEALREVAQLEPAEEGLRATYQALADAAPLTVQRIHGDLHLGQMLRTAQRWIMLDFEGEPAKTIVERRAPDSPLRDVAGMLRSFDYAANHQSIDSGSTPQRDYRAREWSERNSDTFCAGYAEAAGHDPRDQATLLASFEADKAVYETLYEARNRPTWLPVPVASLDRIAHRAEDS